MSFADQKLDNTKLEDTIFNTVTAMARRLVLYNNTESNVRVSTLSIICLVSKKINYALYDSKS